MGQEIGVCFTCNARRGHHHRRRRVLFLIFHSVLTSPFHLRTPVVVASTRRGKAHHNKKRQCRWDTAQSTSSMWRISLHLFLFTVVCAGCLDVVTHSPKKRMQLLSWNKELCQSSQKGYDETSYADLMNTTFALLPAGRSPATYRLGEALSAGALPVFIHQVCTLYADV